MRQQKRGTRLSGYRPDYVVFDLETTGLSPITDGIIEISAVKVKGGKVTDRFSTLVNPGRRIPAAATRVNGITDEMVKDAPGLREALDRFLAFIEDQVLVGHNIHSFDMGFLNHAMEELYQKSLSNDYIDTLYMARSCLKELSHHRLVDLAAHFDISTEGAHRALNDCIMNQKCYEKMGKIMETVNSRPGSGETCPRCGAELVKRNGKFGQFYGCSSFPNCRYTKNI
ncbi:MAG: DNA polymerase III subunit epsilon [Hungatella sp.]|nr:DNA polymerase III subunit epsilon [Hungatella sp.]